jgi:hypothetical protein
MPLSGKDVEAAFVETAREQVSGEPFDWERCARHLNARQGRGARFMLTHGDPHPEQSN